jgi:hypothetical protein
LIFPNAKVLWRIQANIIIQVMIPLDPELAHYLFTARKSRKLTNRYPIVQTAKANRYNLGS